MEIKEDRTSELFQEKNDGNRFKSSLRMQYESQVEVIKKQIGEIEVVRNRLGLSQRKMAQLLLVDPSAWSRWMKNESQIPPLVWRSLQWFLITQDKIPGLTSEYFIGKSSLNWEKKEIDLLKSQNKELFDSLAKMNFQFKFFKRAAYISFILTVLIGFMLLISINS